MALSKMRGIDLLLIGKTGNGKSATGNTILGHKAFKSQSSQSSVTSYAQSEVAEYNGRVIKVVDTPGVGDTRMDTQEGTNLVMDAMQQAIASNPRGYHAFLLVVRFGGRFTQEDADTITFLKGIFGKDFVRKHCILIMTYGDNFENDSEDTGVTFEYWCEQQEGVFKILYEECDKRILLFDNGTRDKNKKQAQLAKLVEVIDTLWQPGHRYTDENFERAREAREKFLVESKEPQIRDEMMQETSLILQKLVQIQAMEPKDQLEPLERLIELVDALYENIQHQDKGTGALKKLLKQIKNTKQTVEDEIKFCKRIIEMKEKMTAQQQAEKREFEAKIRQLQGAYQELRVESDKGIVEKVVDVVAWPFKTTAKGIDWVGGKISGWFSS